MRRPSAYICLHQSIGNLAALTNVFANAAAVGPAPPVPARPTASLQILVDALCTRRRGGFGFFEARPGVVVGGDLNVPWGCYLGTIKGHTTASSLISSSSPPPLLRLGADKGASFQVVASSSFSSSSSHSCLSSHFFAPLC